MRKQKGITLIALVVTIVVLLILSGVVLNIVLGNNGIINRAQFSKEETEVASEKDVITIAAMDAYTSEGNLGKFDKDLFKKSLIKIAGEDKIEINDMDIIIEVLFKQTNRYYQIDEYGNIGDAQIIAKDEYAGDITKGGQLDGSEERPYEIRCIEDLVAMSNMGKSFSGYSGKAIILTRNLNFKSKYSYADSTTTKFGDINGDDTDGNMLITEMTTGKGFLPIGNSYWFSGTFDGNGYRIDDIYINKTGNAGLFAQVGNATIKNIIISGDVETTESSGGYAGGICGRIQGSVNIINCINLANVSAYEAAGGICGSAYAPSTGNHYVINIQNSYNLGNITGNNRCGGIIGLVNKDNAGINETYITNCINLGKAKEGNLSGTICGIVRGDTSNLILEDVYYLENTNTRITSITVTGCINGILTSGYVSAIDSNVATQITEQEIKNNNNFINILNSNIGSNTQWKTWKIGSDGWPTLDFKIKDN